MSDFVFSLWLEFKANIQAQLWMRRWEVVCQGQPCQAEIGRSCWKQINIIAHAFYSIASYFGKNKIEWT